MERQYTGTYIPVQYSGGSNTYEKYTKLTPKWRLELIKSFDRSGKKKSINNNKRNNPDVMHVSVRSGQPGYNRPTFVRIAVREPSKVDVRIKTWEQLCHE
ncbi:2219_t:CDS:2 [Entrophospora sp. SA101]|nr:12012_t:CDS:2 [Entrophospora sp. SA101]CAJ0747211.1 2219_t:CDS:2 [Entrophospora sp. SA101]CAJ0846082.1 6244_t:CDS:2 [Entrophospora sp. SA101]